MTGAEALLQLESAGSAQTRKTYAKHGAQEPMFGVSYATLGVLKKRIKRDHALALELWDSGNHDARVLATMIADPALIKMSQLEAWAKAASNKVLIDAVSALAKQTSAQMKEVAKWTASKDEWVGRLGWSLLSHIAQDHEEIDDAKLEPYLEVIQSGIHKAKNRTREAMNGALIGIGMRGGAIKGKAIAVAKAIGKVEVDHGDTSCKTPDAVAYIQKATSR